MGAGYWRLHWSTVLLAMAMCVSESLFHPVCWQHKNLNMSVVPGNVLGGGNSIEFSLPNLCYSHTIVLPLGDVTLVLSSNLLELVSLRCFNLPKTAQNFSLHYQNP